MSGVPVTITSVGAAAGELRLPLADIGAAWGRGGTGQVAVTAPDEDTLTLAWAAADAALAAARRTGATIDGLWWGTTRPPFGEGPSHAVLANCRRTFRFMRRDSLRARLSGQAARPRC